MRRKYDLRNKRNFIIILILAIMVVGIFSLFIYRYKHTSKIEYKIETGSVLQDTNKNTISFEEDGILKVRWNGYYYLIYQDKKINLSKNVIVYNTITGSMNLYGKYYEILEDGEVKTITEENELKNTTNAKFYKIDDREYLLVDNKIFSEDRSIEASNYMLVELDKMGNAKLSNNKLNLKTIIPTVLVTSKYTFDIANEILKYGKKDINLKKIIGSTNQYIKKEEPEIKDEGNSSGNGWNSNINGGGAGAGNVINNNSTGEVSDIGEIKNKTKMTSIINTTEKLTQIDVDYVVYDPYNEYKSVYAEIIKPGKIEVVYLSKTDTHIVFSGLVPNTEYTFNFVYTTENEETGETIRNTFETITLKTKMPTYSISILRVSNVDNTLTYKVKLQEGYAIDKLNVRISFDYRVVDSETGTSTIRRANIPVTHNVSEGNTRSVSLAGYNIDNGTLITLSIDSVVSGSKTINVNSTDSFRLGE